MALSPPRRPEVLARWREAGAWWEGERPREFVQWRDARGVRREKDRELPALTGPYTPATAVEDHREDYALRPRKTRDEKVAKACGLLAESPSLLTGRSARGATRAGVPLHLLSGYSFGRSVLLAREIPRRCALLGLPAAALVDRFALTGAVEFAREARAHGVKPLIGASFEMAEGGEVVLIARDASGYRSLSRLVTECHLCEPRLYPLCTVERMEQHAEGLVCLTGGDEARLARLLLAGDQEGAMHWLDLLVGLYGRESVFVEVERSHLPWGLSLESRLLEVAERFGLRAVAGGAVTHADPSDFPTQDIVVCADTLCVVDEVVGRKPVRHPTQPQVADRPARALNAERYLRPSEETVALFADRPDLVEATHLVAELCDDDVLPGRTRLPALAPDSGAALREAVTDGARQFHHSVSNRHKKRLDNEVDRIVRMGYADHFLVAWDMCRWARGQGILFSGRGSMVDSAVAYCLGISRVDAFRHDLHFDRFLPEDGSKRPDIDIDFEARRREDVRQYLIDTYGQDRVATVAAVGAYCTRGIVREVGKALGLSQEAIGFLAKRLHGGVRPDQLEEALARKPELRASEIPKERLFWLFRLADALADVPRNMRAHSSGIVVSDRPLADTVPVQWAGPQPPTTARDDDEDEGAPLKIVQWDKRSAKHYFDKFDVLCLRGHDALSGAQRWLRRSDPDFDVDALPAEAEENFRTMRSGELIGIPQSASPAMRQAHMRLQTTDLHDASLVQAGIRPGVGGAVKINELIARRRGLKPYSFEHPDLEGILGISYGIVVFQEQIDQLLQVFGGYGSGEAEDIRDAIHKRRREDYGQTLREEILGRIVARGYSQAVAEHVFELIAGFKGYGFAQGHALAFAEISLRAVYCQQNFPAPYFAGLLDAQPAGYYGPCTLVNEARSRGIVVLPPCVLRSDVGYRVEDVQSSMDPRLLVPGGGIRVGLSSIAGLGRATVERTVREFRQGGEDRGRAGLAAPSFYEFVRRVRPNRDELEALILAGALDTVSPNRRALLWAVAPTLEAADRPQGGLGLDEAAPTIDPTVADFTPAEKAVRERIVLGLDVERHLMAFERERVSSRGGLTTAEVKGLPPGRRAIVVGNPIRLRFPPTPSGKRVVFFDLEDEAGLLNVTCFDAVYQRDGHAIVCEPYLTLIGVTQWRDGHTAFLTKRAFPYEPTIKSLIDTSEELPIVRADFLAR